MAIQMWTPMAPMADNREIGAAIAGAGQDLGRGLAGIAERMEKRKEEQKREQTNAKAALTLFKANPELQKATGMDEHTFTGLPRLDQIAAVRGGITALTLMRENQRAAQERQRYEQEVSSGAALQQMAGATAQGNLEQLYENPEAYQGAPAFDQALFRNPAAVNAPNFNEFSRAVASTGRGGRVKEPTEKTIGGRSVIYSPDTGAFQVMPPAQPETEAQEIFDGEGNLIGHNVPTGGGKWNFRPLKAQASGQLQPVMDPTTGKPVPGFGMDATGRVHDFRDKAAKEGYDRVLGAGNAETSPAPAKAQFRWDPKANKLERNP
jgi:hypothetical protein